MSIEHRTIQRLLMEMFALFLRLQASSRLRLGFTSNTHCRGAPYFALEKKVNVCVCVCVYAIGWAWGLDWVDSAMSQTAAGNGS